MRFITATLTIAAACASAAVAAASPARLSDVQFIAANRCVGIESAKAFAGPDVAALRQLVKTQQWGRDSFLYDKADQARQDGEREASRTGAESSMRLAAERDGVCRNLASTITASSGSGATHTMIQ
ncbi:MAG TPA: hypothetical protein VFE13_21005 [Caulobacteraceae bacterium]|nr:hypothetical protein [Caulobacteraceae bacterium]